MNRGYLHIGLAVLVLLFAGFVAFMPVNSPVGFSTTDFFLMAAPVMNNPILNSTFGANFTNENLTCYTNATDADGDQVTYRGFWFRDDHPYFYYWINITGTPGGTGGSQPINGVAVDSFDNIAAAGIIDVSGKMLDFFVVKYDENGTQLWNRSDGSTRSDFATSVAVDSLENIIAAGVIQNITSTQYDIWVWKLNPSGTILWNVTAGNPSRPDRALGVAVDSADNITVVGYNETAGTSGGRSIYLWKYNSSGSKLWEKTIRAPATYSSEANGVAIDSDDNITITGYMFFTSGLGVVSQVFTAKLDPLGNQIKNVTFNYSGSTSNIGNDVAIDSNDNIFVVGNAGFNSIPIAFIVKYDSNLVHQWNRTINLTGVTTFGESGLGVAIDDEDKIYVTGVTNRTILLVKYDTNGNQLWNLSSSYGASSQGLSIDIDSKNYIVIGGRNVNGSNDFGYVLKYYGFENLNQAQGVLVNSSTIPESVTEVGDVWMCDSRALDATAKTTYVQSNNLTIRAYVPTQIQCSINVPNNFSSCSNLTFFDNITQVRANCSGAVNATFNLTNVFDGTTFFVNTTSTVSGDFLVLDNADVQVLDSGNWSLYALCDYGTIQGNDTANFSIPFGNISNAQMLSSSLSVANGQSFAINTRIQCVGGECVNISVVLDPIQFASNLTDASAPVQSVFADSEFIYAASQDNNVYVYNKSSLGLYATLSDTNGLQAVHADSDYIYAGGWNNKLLIWNRTDYSTPFASVYNVTGLLSNIIAISSDNDNIYVGFKGSSFLRVFNKSDPSFRNFRNLTGPTNIVRDLEINGNFLYAGTHSISSYGRVFVYNRTNLSQSPVNLATCIFCDVKAVAVDSNYIYAYGHDYNNPFLIVYNKTSYATVRNDTSVYTGVALAGTVGNDSFTYIGGNDISYTNGRLLQINKSGWGTIEQHNITNYHVKSLYCDDTYLYAGLMDNSYLLGMVSLFNNPCYPPPAAPISINSLGVVPSYPGVPSTAYCSANVTASGTIDNVTFYVTFPDSSVVVLGSSNVSEIFNSSGFSVSATGSYLCNVTANDTLGNRVSLSSGFLGGYKGAIPMNSGSPFYTTSQNPRNGSHQACLLSLIPGQNCDSSWNVVANGVVGQTYLFFATYTGSELNTSSINVTITGGPSPPAPSGGGGGGGATRMVNVPPPFVETPSPCVENWACGDWDECVDGVMKRVCFDSNRCNSTVMKPFDSQPCVVPEPVVVEKSIPAAELGEVSEKKAPVVPSKSEEPQPAILKGVFVVLLLFGIVLLFVAFFFVKPPSEESGMTP